MKKLQHISFHLHWITLCCSLLPFFYDSCANEKKPEETGACDTCVVVTTNLEDSISQQSHPVDTASTITIDTTADTTELSKSNKDEILSEKNYQEIFHIQAHTNT